MQIKKPIVVAISSISGGGKTTIVNELSKIVPDSKALFFDDYDFNGPDDICEWVERGANYNEWDLSPMVNDLNKMLADKLSLLNYVFIDYPFARLNTQLSTFIDFTVFIDTPLDVALARRILRDFNDCEIKSVHDDIRMYLLRGRLAYLEMLETIKPSCDKMLDGLLPLNTIVKQVCKDLIRFRNFE